MFATKSTFLNSYTCYNKKYFVILLEKCQLFRHMTETKSPEPFCGGNSATLSPLNSRGTAEKRPGSPAAKQMFQRGPSAENIEKPQRHDLLTARPVNWVQRHAAVNTR